MLRQLEDVSKLVMACSGRLTYWIVTRRDLTKKGLIALRDVLAEAVIKLDKMIDGG